MAELEQEFEAPDLPSFARYKRSLRCVSPERMEELLAAEADRDRLAAVIEQVRALCEEAKAAAAACRAESGESYYYDDVDPDDILALLPPATQPTQETT